MQLNSIRKTILTLAVTAPLTALLGGCVVAQNPGPDFLDPEPIKTDEAMANRTWDGSSAYYARSGVIAGPTGYTFRPDGNQSPYTYPLTEVPVFLANIALIPYQIYLHPPGSKIEYRASTVEPTYSAMPPLPPEQRQVQPTELESTTPEEPLPTTGPSGTEIVLPPSPGAEPSDRPLDQPPSTLPTPSLEPTTRPSDRND